MNRQVAGVKLVGAEVVQHCVTAQIVTAWEKGIVLINLLLYNNVLLSTLLSRYERSYRDYAGTLRLRRRAGKPMPTRLRGTSNKGTGRAKRQIELMSSFRNIVGIEASSRRGQRILRLTGGLSIRRRTTVS